MWLIGAVVVVVVWWFGAAVVVVGLSLLRLPRAGHRLSFSGFVCCSLTGWCLGNAVVFNVAGL